MEVAKANGVKKNAATIQRRVTPAPLISPCPAFWRKSSNDIHSGGRAARKQSTATLEPPKILDTADSGGRRESEHFADQVIPIFDVLLDEILPRAAATWIEEHTLEVKNMNGLTHYRLGGKARPTPFSSAQIVISGICTHLPRFFGGGRWCCCSSFLHPPR